MEVAEFLMRVSTPPQHKQKKRTFRQGSDSILPLHAMTAVPRIFLTPKWRKEEGGKPVPSLYVPLSATSS